MSAALILALRMGLLAALWLFILLALRSLRHSTAGPVRGPAHTPPPPTGNTPPRYVVIVDGPLQGSAVELDQYQEISIGRSPECLCVVQDDYASSRHARLFFHAGEWFVEDLDSRNGTFVAGLPIDQPERVSAGSDITIGRTTVRLVP